MMATVSVGLMVLVCLATGLAIRLLRRLPRLVFVATLIGALGLAVLLATATDAPGDFLGRTLTLDAAARAFLGLSMTMAAALALFGPLTFGRASNAPSAVIANSQGAFFFFSLAPLTLAIVIDSFPLAVFAWAIGLIVLMLLAQPAREGRVGGAAQFLLLTVIAVACLLLSNRFFDLYPLTPENLDLIRNTVVFLALGMGLLLAVVPLHIWLGPLADEMPVLGMAFLVGVAQPVGIWLLMQRLGQVPWLTAKSPLLTVLLYGGVLTAAVGALLALSERRDGRWLVYLSLVPLGHALIGLSLGTQLALTGVMLTLINRAVGIGLIAGGVSFVRYHPERRWQMLGAFAVLFGGLALAGIPPALGLTMRVPIYHDLAAANAPMLLVLLVANAAVLLTTMHAVWDVLKQLPTEDEFTGELKIVPYLCTVVVLVLVVLAVLPGIFPQGFVEPFLATLGSASYLK